MRNTDAAANRGDIYDVTAPLLSHLLQHRKREIDGPPKHHVHGVLEIGVLEAVERPNLDEPCVVYEYVDSSELIDNALDEGANLCLPGDIAGKRGRLDIFLS